MKHPIALLFLFITSLCLSQNVNIDKQLLWEISRDGVNEKSYLFGTLHSNDKRIFALSDSVYFALDTSQLIILEADIFSEFKDVDSRNKLPSTLYDKNGRAYTASETATKTSYGDENGMPQFIDAYFEEYCYNAGKVFVALEKAPYQYPFGSELVFSKRRVINNALNNFSNEKLIELYLKGDITAIERFIRANLAKDKEQFEALITSRNKEIAQTLDSIFNTQASFFCAVGAGHFSGSAGIINLLRKKGYYLRPMLWTLGENKTAAKKAVKSFRNYIYRDSISGLIANFSGKPYEEKNKDGSTHLIYREYGQGNTYSVDLFPNDSTLSFEELAAIYIASPPNTDSYKKILDDGTILFEGLSDTYPEGLNWVRILFSEKYFAVLKSYGGNKFTHSDRPKKFFDNVWFE